MALSEYVAQRLRELRESYGNPQGLSQEALAREVGVAPNTISRWETGANKPNLDDLERLSRFFGVSIFQFFPDADRPPEGRLAPLMRAAEKLPSSDLDELRRYAEYRRARSIYRPGRPGRKAGPK